MTSLFRLAVALFRKGVRAVQMVGRASMYAPSSPLPAATLSPPPSCLLLCRCLWLCPHMSLATDGNAPVPGNEPGRPNVTDSGLAAKLAITLSSRCMMVFFSLHPRAKALKMVRKPVNGAIRLVSHGYRVLLLALAFHHHYETNLTSPLPFKLTTCPALHFLAQCCRLEYSVSV